MKTIKVMDLCWQGVMVKIFWEKGKTNPYRVKRYVWNVDKLAYSSKTVAQYADMASALAFVYQYWNENRTCICRNYAIAEKEA